MASTKIPFSIFIAELANPDDQVRRKAIQKIMRRRTERGQAFLSLAPLVSDPAYPVRKQAVRALGRLGDARAFPYLEQALKTTPWNIHLEVANTLAELGQTPHCAAQAAAFLNNLLLNDSAASVRQAALRGLLKVKGPFTVQELLDALVGTSQVLRDHAVRELSRVPFSQVGPTLLTLTTHSNVAVCIAALQILQCYLRPEVVDCFIKALRDQREMVRFWAANGLLCYARWFADQGDMSAGEPLLGALGDASWIVRRRAVSGLGELRDRRAVEPLLSMLNDTNDVVRASVAFALGSLKDARAVEPLIAALNDAHFKVRLNAVSALGTLKDARAVEPLIAVLNDADASVRRHAVTALGSLKDARAVEPLIARLKDTDRSVRYQAVCFLGELGDTRAVEPLLAMLNDTERDIREMAIKVLGELKDPRAIGSLEHAPGQ